MTGAVPPGVDGEATAVLQRLVSGTPGGPPRVFLVLGSGLGSLRDRVEGARQLPFRALPGFAAAGVEGHPGRFVAGRLAHVPVLVQAGRLHLYEGHPPERVAAPVRMAAAVGATTVILTNAAGGIRSDLKAGAIVLLEDLVNVTFRNPLIGALRPGEDRFPDVGAPFDPELRALSRNVARERSLRLEGGVYAGVQGPSFETPAEIRMLARLGGHLVGMSTVLEVVQARALGMRTLGFSLVTNPAAGTGGRRGARLTHEEVVATAAREGRRLGGLIEGVVRRIGSGTSSARAGREARAGRDARVSEPARKRRDAPAGRPERADPPERDD